MPPGAKKMAAHCTETKDCQPKGLTTVDLLLPNICLKPLNFVKSSLSTEESLHSDSAYGYL